MALMASLSLTQVAAAQSYFTAPAVWQNVTMPPSVPIIGDAAPLLVDLNQDGLLDIFKPVMPTGQVATFIATGIGTFNVPVPTVVSLLSNSTPTPLAVRDLNNDGLLDVVVLSGVSGIQNLFGVGGGAFTPTLPLPGTQNTWPALFVLDDLDHDGTIEMAGHFAMAGLPFPAVHIWRNVLGQWFYLQSIPLPGSSTEMRAGDFNGDGWTELAFVPAITGPFAAGIHVLVHTGNGLNFSLQGPYPSAHIPSSQPYTYADDLDGDGCDDFIANSFGTLLCKRGHPQSILISEVASPNQVGGWLEQQPFQDFDGDGFKDYWGWSVEQVLFVFPITYEVRGVLSCYRGSGAFSSRMDENFGTVHWRGSVGVGDLDFDGDPDLVVFRDHIGQPTEYAVWWNQAILGRVRLFLDDSISLPGLAFASVA